MSTTTENTPPAGLPQIWFTREEAADYCRVRPRTIDRWANEGRLVRHKVTGLQSVRFKRYELDAIMVPEG